MVTFEPTRLAKYEGVALILMKSVVKEKNEGEGRNVHVVGNEIARLDNVVTTSSDLLQATPTLKP